jgi:Ca-activated chloride channel family protein
MTGCKIDRARDAARALVNALGETDSFAMIEFGSEASVLFPASPMKAQARALVLEAIDRLVPMGGTNMSEAFDLAAAELRRGSGGGRISKVFLASDGQANEGISDQAGLLALARRDFPEATLSTFGMGEDYDEDIMNAFAAQSGGRARYISSPDVLPSAFRDELSRSAATVARDVRLRIDGPVERALGYEIDGGYIRLTDFAAGEERRVLVKLRVPPGPTGLAEIARVDLQYDADGRQAFAHDSAAATWTADVRLVPQRPTELGMRYGRIVQMVDAAQSKAEKEQAFDAVRAPVKGW